MKNEMILKVIKVLSDSVRLRIIKILLRKELWGYEIEAGLKMSEPRISRHLKILKEAILVNCRRDGEWCYYRVENKYLDFLTMLKKYFKKEKLYISDLKKLDKTNISCSIKEKMYDYLITMGCKDKCPFYPTRAFIEWDLPDIKEGLIDKIRALREDIKKKVEKLIKVQYYKYTMMQDSIII